MGRKLTALILAVCLLGSAAAFAAEETPEKPALSGVCDTGDGSFLATDTFNKVLWRVKDGVLTRYAGAIPVADLSGEPQGLYYGGFANGPATSARFDQLQGLAADADGTICVADTLNRAIRMIRDGRVYTVMTGVTPRGMAIQNGSIYAADLLSGNLVDAKLPTGSYADVSADAWYGSYIKETTLRGLINGTDSNRFSPQLKLDRAMFVTVLSRLHSYTDGTVVIDGDETFPDVAEGIWYAASARWAADNGIVTGMDGAFAPTAAVTREQLATMLYRYAKARGLDVSASAELDVFSDADSVSGWAVSAMRWAVAADVVGGENGLLRPGVPATRAEAVTIVIRFMDACGM